MKIKDRIVGLCLLLFIGCFLTGCQLAREEYDFPGVIRVRAGLLLRP